MAAGNYIVVEGPIGVGKTTLAKLLGERLRARLELEEAEANPFLADFYRDPKRLAFKAQMFFLLTRYYRQRELRQPELFDRYLVADYLFAKDRIFAQVNLDENEIALYEGIYRLLEPRVAKPDLVVCLQADTSVLVDRVRERGYAFEKEISEEYLDRVNQAYARFFFHYRDTPLLNVNTGDIDFVQNREDLNSLIKEIVTMSKGTRYFTPLRSTFLD